MKPLWIIGAVFVLWIVLSFTLPHFLRWFTRRFGVKFKSPEERYEERVRSVSNALGDGKDRRWWWLVP